MKRKGLKTNSRRVASTMKTKIKRSSVFAQHHKRGSDQRLLAIHKRKKTDQGTDRSDIGKIWLFCTNPHAKNMPKNNGKGPSAHENKSKKSSWGLTSFALGDTGDKIRGKRQGSNAYFIKQWTVRHEGDSTVENNQKWTKNGCTPMKNKRKIHTIIPFSYDQKNC